MKMLLKTSPTDLKPITTIHDLQAEARRISAGVKTQELELRAHLKKLPREVMKAGVGNVIPAIVNSKMAGIALTAGTALLGNYFLPKTAASTAGIIGNMLKKAGIASLGKLALGWFTKKNKE